MSNANPAVLVDGYASFPRVAVTGGSTVTIQLKDSSGVFLWDVECIGTDELNNATTINAAKTINHANNTCTFTFPSTNGCALIWKSTVNDGKDTSGQINSALSTTFKVISLTAHGYEIGAQNETTESGNFGWLTVLNTAIRAL